MKELYRDQYYVMRADGDLVRLERTATAYPSLQALDAANAAMIGALRASGIRRVLLDLRAGPPGRNDPAFEAAIGPWRRQLDDLAERVALLMRSVAGKLQTQRMARNEGRAEAAFLDEAEAIAFLRKP